MAQYVLHRVLVIDLVFNNVRVRGGNPTIVHFCCLREFLDAHHFFLLAILSRGLSNIKILLRIKTREISNCGRSLIAPHLFDSV